MAAKKRVYARKNPRQERSAEMVETILEAAARVFVREGYARATTNRIAEAANVSVGSLYQYFSGKDAIAIELLRRYRESLIAIVASHIPNARAGNVDAFVRALLTDLLRVERIHPTLQRVLIEQVLRTDARREMLGFEERVEAMLAQALRTADLGERPIEMMAFVLVRVVLSVVQGVVADRPKLNGPELVDELTRLVTHYVGASAP